MSAYRFVYCVSGVGGSLQATVRALRQGLLPCEIAGVVADRESPAAARAREAGFKVCVVDFSAFPSREAYDAEFRNVVRSFAPDGIVLNYARMLDAETVARYPSHILNVHYSLLPTFPGFGHTRKAAEGGVRIAGATVHIVDKGMDSGPIIAQGAVELQPGLTASQIGRKIFLVAAPMQIQAMRWLATGRLTLTAERRVEIEGASFESLPFVPALDPDIAAFARAFS
ncbi:MAG: phosphoribosylglycinamide formyltransferase [Rhodospirillales bacterium]|nr:phosphoribosylglycinamide formyltransferase [Rhodospirillales bacterium]